MLFTTGNTSPNLPFILQVQFLYQTLDPIAQLVFIIFRKASIYFVWVIIGARPVTASVAVITVQPNSKKMSKLEKRNPQVLSYLQAGVSNRCKNIVFIVLTRVCCLRENN